MGDSEPSPNEIFLAYLVLQGLYYCKLSLREHFDGQGDTDSRQSRGLSAAVSLQTCS